MSSSSCCATLMKSSISSSSSSSFLSSSSFPSLASGCVSWKVTLSSLPGRADQSIALRASQRDLLHGLSL
jgi:hypothetical protein